MLLTFTPELGEPRPQAQIEASLGHYGRHYFLYSSTALSGRGVTYLSTVKPGDMLTDRRDGWHRYKVTAAAYDRICKDYTVSEERLLD